MHATSNAADEDSDAPSGMSLAIEPIQSGTSTPSSARSAWTPRRWSDQSRGPPRGAPGSNRAVPKPSEVIRTPDPAGAGRAAITVAKGRAIGKTKPSL